MATEAIPITSIPKTGEARKPPTEDRLKALDMNEFLKLMITEMQNQDPLNPMENAEILSQISQIREIGATDKLSTTLDSVLLGQQISSAGTMISKNIKGLAETGKDVTGIVDRVSMDKGKAVLHIGADKIPLANVREILPDAET